MLDAARLNGALGSPPGLWREVRVVEETGSTNADLLAKARSGAGEGLVLVAEAQTSGRGRMGRRWISPPRRALTFSVLLRPAVPAGLLGWAPLLAWKYSSRETPIRVPLLPSPRAVIPAPTHVDGTGRLQTVTREANPRYHALISAFRDLTGVPVVLNTSFNDNEPIVCRPEEAIDCFQRTKMDGLVLDDLLITRP